MHAKVNRNQVLALFYDSECLNTQVFSGLLIEKLVFSVYVFIFSKWMVFQGVNTNIKVKNPLDIVENGDVLFPFGGLVWKWVQDAKSMISIVEVNYFYLLAYKVFSYGFSALNFWLTCLDI